MHRLVAFFSTATLLLALAPDVMAHDGEPVSPDGLGVWNWDVWLLGTLALAGAIYAVGTHRLWRRAGRGRGIRRWQLCAASGGVLALLAALVSPLEAASGALFSAHMLQHLLLILVAAPLLVLGNPVLPGLWALPHEWRRALAGWWVRSRRLRSVWHVLFGPLPVLALHTAVVWAWHAPPLYQLALERAWVHTLEHLTLFATAVLFWSVVLLGPWGRLGYGLGVLYLFAATMQSGFLAALITLSPTPWYSVHAAGAEAWGMTALEDQQLAGLIMWVPAGAVYLVAALALMALWLKAVDRRRARAQPAPIAWHVREESIWG